MTTLSRQEGVDLLLCECGPNISGAIDLARVEAVYSSDPQVRSVQSAGVLCSEEGREWLENYLRRSAPRSIVVAACTPREHLKTFQQVCRQADTNPHLLTMVNLREQCAWVTADREQATAKAIRLVRAGVRRALHLSPLEEKSVACNPDVLVVGAGVAGLQAAWVLAQADRHVTLVERDPCVGGLAVQQGDQKEDEQCASCVLGEMVDEVLHHPRIEIFTCAELRGLVGSWGNFSATILQRPRHVDPLACYGCPQCIEVCPVPSGGKDCDGGPGHGAIFIPYEGARPNVPAVDESACLYFLGERCDACARACPFDAILLEQEEQEVIRKAGAVVLATGARLPGESRTVTNRAALERVAPQMLGARGSDALARLARVTLAPAGFFALPWPWIRPAQTAVEGILAAGSATGPKDVQSCVTEGAAAAARILATLVPGRQIPLEPAQAVVNSELCGGCKTCLTACPFSAIRMDEQALTAEVDERLCRGCGSCAARCPSGAVEALAFTDDQLRAEIEGLL